MNLQKAYNLSSPEDNINFYRGWAEDYDADFTIVDPKMSHTISNAEQASKSGWTPYDGKKITGLPNMTIIRGQMVMREGDLLDKIIAEPIAFNI